MKSIFLLAAISIATSVQASGNFSMIEINPAHGTEAFIWSDSAKNVYGAGEMSNFTELNGKLFFVARNQFDNDELWATDGTQAGTYQVKDINPNGGSMVGNLVKVGNRLLFMAADNNNWDFDIWSTDGTETGTIKLADVNQNVNTGLSAQNAAVFGNRLIFCSPTQLMVTDGTPSGTDSIMAITQYAQGFGYCELNNKVYFVIGNSMGQNEIWRTDGTTGGTQFVLNIESSPNNFIGVMDMQSFNGKIYFAGAKNGTGYDLYSFDGTPGGTIQKIDLAPGGSSYPSNFKLHQGALYFTASTMTSANVFKIAAGSSTPQELMPNAAFGWINNISFTDNNIYFLAENQQDVHRIDLNTLTNSVFHLPAMSIPNYIAWNNLSNNFLVEEGGRLFFSAYDSLTNKQLLFAAKEDFSNLTELAPSATNIMHPFNAIVGCGMADVFDFFVWGDKVLIPANFNEAGRELWIYSTAVLNAIDPITSENDLNVFPNPATNEITVSTDNSGYCEQWVQLINVNGQVLSSEKLTGSKTTIHVSFLLPGNYIAALIENGKLISARKLAVIR